MLSKLLTITFFSWIHKAYCNWLTLRTSTFGFEDCSSTYLYHRYFCDALKSWFPNSTWSIRPYLSLRVEKALHLDSIVTSFLIFHFFLSISIYLYDLVKFRLHTLFLPVLSICIALICFFNKHLSLLINLGFVIVLLFVVALYINPKVHSTTYLNPIMSAVYQIIFFHKYLI